MHRLQGSCRLVLLGLAAVGTLLVLAALLAQPAEARTITVDDDGPADYDNLRDATNNASAGDTIFIYPGNYLQLAPINDSVTYIGAARDEVIIYKISVYSDENITMMNFSALYALVDSSRQIVFENIRFYTGISSHYGFNISIYNSTFEGDQSHHPINGILLSFCNGFRIINNTFVFENQSKAASYGIKGTAVSDITVIGNSFYGQDVGIFLGGYYNSEIPNIISRNTFEKHDIAIHIASGNNSEVSFNVIQNSKVGIKTMGREKLNGNVFKNVDTEYSTPYDDEWDPLPGFGFSFNLLSFSIVLLLVRTTSRRRRRTRAPHSRS